MWQGCVAMSYLHCEAIIREGMFQAPVRFERQGGSRELQIVASSSLVGKAGACLVCSEQGTQLI